MEIPADIFTERDDVDPDTLANLGPLRRLAGIWEGKRGVDIAPKAEGPEQREFFERIVMQPIDPQSNGPQLLYGLRYHHHVNTLEEDITFHDQVGFWLYEPATGLIMQSLAIPRGQVALAAGHAKPGDTRLTLEATRGTTEYGIASTWFLEQAFRTDSYRIDVEFHEDGSWSYEQDTLMTVRGQAEPFHHKDRSRLVKVGDADLNPWLKIVRGQQTG